MALPGVPNIASAGVAILPNVTPNFAQQLTRQVGPAVGLAGQAVGAAFTAGLVGSIGVALAASDAFVPFEESLTRITTLVGIAKEEVDGLGQAALELAPETGRGPQELADALFFITSAGLRGETALEALDAAAKAAALGLGETEVVADAATSAMNAYGSENLSAADAVGVLVKSVEQGKLEADSLAQSIGRVIPLASEAGVSFQEVGAALAAVSRTGLDANEGATALRGILATIVRPTTQAKDALAEYGLTTDDLRRTIEEDGLLGLLDLLRVTVGDNTEALATIIPNIRALTGFLSLTGSQAESTARIFGELTDVTGVLDERFAAVQDSQAFRRQAAEAARTAVLIGEGSEAAEALTQILEEIPGILEAVIPPLSRIGTLLLGFGGDLTAGVGVLVDGFRSLNPAIQGTIGVVGGLTGALALLYANPVIGGLALVAAGIAGIGAAAKESEADIDRWGSAIRQVGDDGNVEAIGTTADAVQALVDAADDPSFWTKYWRGFGEVTDNLAKADLQISEIAEAIEADLFGTIGEGGAVIDTWREVFRELGTDVNLDNLNPAEAQELVFFLDSLIFAQRGYREEVALTNREAIAGGIEATRTWAERREALSQAAQKQAELNRFLNLYNTAVGDVQPLVFPVRSVEEYRAQVGGLIGDLAAVEEGVDAVNQAFLEQVNPTFAAINGLTELEELIAQVDEDGQRTSEELIGLASKGEEVSAAFAAVADDPAAQRALERALINWGGDYEKVLADYNIDLEDFTGEWSTTLQDGTTLDGTATGEELLAEFAVGIELFNQRFGGIAEPVFDAAGELVAAKFADGSIVPLSQLAPDWEAEVRRQAAIVSQTSTDEYGRPLGKDFGDGIVAGVDFQFQLQQKALDQINRARAYIQGDQEIDSPSKVWAREVGQPLGEGVIAGFNAGLAGGFTDQINAAAEAVNPTLVNPITGAGSTINVYNAREESIAAGIQQGAAVSKVILA